MDLRKRRKHSVDKLPVGATRWRRVKRADGGRFKVKVIKISNRGPRGSQWIRYSRYLYEQRHGQVPKGKRVIHKDGDLTNFEPDNLVLGTAADVLWVHCHADRAKSESNRLACVAGTIRANIERGEIRRRIAPLPTRWYPVDLARRVIVNSPRRSLCGLLGRPGVFSTAAHTGWRLGWPELSAAGASFLAVLTKVSGPRRLREIQAGVEKLRIELMIEPARIGISRIRCVAVELVAAGLAVRLARGLYEATPAALAARGPVCPFVFVRGRELAGVRFAGFELVDSTQEALSA